MASSNALQPTSPFVLLVFVLQHWLRLSFVSSPVIVSILLPQWPPPRKSVLLLLLGWSLRLGFFLFGIFVFVRLQHLPFLRKFLFFALRQQTHLAIEIPQEGQHVIHRGSAPHVADINSNQVPKDLCLVNCISSHYTLYKFHLPRRYICRPLWLQDVHQCSCHRTSLQVAIFSCTPTVYTQSSILEELHEFQFFGSRHYHVILLKGESSLPAHGSMFDRPQQRISAKVGTLVPILVHQLLTNLCRHAIPIPEQEIKKWPDQFLTILPQFNVGYLQQNQCRFRCFPSACHVSCRVVYNVFDSNSPSRRMSARSARFVSLPLTP